MSYNLTTFGINTMTTTQFSIRLSDDLKKSLETISKISHYSQAQIATKAIAEYVEKTEWKLKSIQEAKKEADKGIFVSIKKLPWIGWIHGGMKTNCRHRNPIYFLTSKHEVCFTAIRKRRFNGN